MRLYHIYLSSCLLMDFWVFLYFILWIKLLWTLIYKSWVKHIFSCILCRCLRVELLHQRRQWHPTPVLLLGKSHGWRSLVGCSPWGLEESDMIERLHFHFSLLCTGEGNGNPLQCSCLENPRDGVTQSQTPLKWLSSSSSIISVYLTL